MRLNATEFQAIRKTLHAVDPDGKVYLSGSRADNRRRGGDIDLARVDMRKRSPRCNRAGSHGCQ